jgi:hypothetical protein
LLGIALVCGLGLASAACGDDTPFVPKDDAGIDAPNPAATFTTFVLDLVNNHTNDPTPATYDSFKDLPDPDGDANNTTAYQSLFQ